MHEIPFTAAQLTPKSKAAISTQAQGITTMHTHLQHNNLCSKASVQMSVVFGQRRGHRVERGGLLLKSTVDFSLHFVLMRDALRPSGQA